MDIKSAVVYMTLLLIGMGLMIDGAGWVFRQQVLLRRDESTDRIGTEIRRVLHTLGRCLEPASVHQQPGLWTAPVQSCVWVTDIQPDPRQGDYRLTFGSLQEAAMFASADVFSLRPDQKIILERDGCSLTPMSRPRADQLTLSTRRYAGSCPPPRPGLFKVAWLQPLDFRFDATSPRGIFLDILEHKSMMSSPILSIKLESAVDFNITYAIGSQRFLAPDPRTGMPDLDLDGNGDGFLGLHEAPVYRPFLIETADQVLFHFIVESNLVEPTGIRCGQAVIHAGERKQCITLSTETL